jgi:hypothetical protein
MTVEQLCHDKLLIDYHLTYRCACNLEGTINNLLHYGLTLEQSEDIVRDILDNYEWVEDISN